VFKPKKLNRVFSASYRIARHITWHFEPHHLCNLIISTYSQRLDYYSRFFCDSNDSGLTFRQHISSHSLRGGSLAQFSTARQPAIYLPDPFPPSRCARLSVHLFAHPTQHNLSRRKTTKPLVSRRLLPLQSPIAEGVFMDC